MKQYTKQRFSVGVYFYECKMLPKMISEITSMNLKWLNQLPSNCNFCKNFCGVYAPTMSDLKLIKKSH